MQQAVFQIVNTEYEYVDTIRINPEYVELVPAQTEEEYTRLKESIADVQLYEPIVINQNKTLLDGHHRLKAVKELGWKQIPVERKHFESKIDEEIYVIETNVIRRHLNQYQKTLMALKLGPLYEEQNKQRQNAGINLPPNLEEGLKPWERETDARAAKAVGLGKTTYQNAKYVLENATVNQIDKFKQGKKRAGSLYREIKHAEKITELRAQIPELEPIEGKYQVIVVDPPWPYELVYDADGRRGACPYPEMTLEEIAELDLPCADDCILWLWTTNRFLHDAFHLVEKWGFETKSILTWVKDKMGLGVWLRGKTEHCILAAKGKPIWDLHDQTTVLEAPNRGHSTKPDEFYELVDQLCIGTKIDWFSRRKREGWAFYGTMEQE